MLPGDHGAMAHSREEFLQMMAFLMNNPPKG
jgi:hypothetical protein